MYSLLNKNWVRNIILLASGSLFGAVVSIAVLNPPKENGPEAERESRLKFENGRLTNPLLECELGEFYISENSIRPFRQVIESKAKALLAGGSITHISYYFRDLNNGSWFGLNEKEMFSPASLLKVPLLIYTLRRAENAPDLLEREIEFTSSPTGTTQLIKPEHPLEDGKSYTLRELLVRMIVDSDNDAAATILSIFGKDGFDTVFTDLGLATVDSIGENSMSVKNYASFFRILFNASYLSRTSSEEALDLMTRVKFTGGLRAGVPPHIPVSHKFGERGDGVQQQLHDCGIIYYPSNPYLLCIMTRGHDFDKLLRAITVLSQETYKEVKRERPN